jgi:hypothetical protein
MLLLLLTVGVTPTLCSAAVVLYSTVCILTLTVCNKLTLLHAVLNGSLFNLHYCITFILKPGLTV